MLKLLTNFLYAIGICMVGLVGLLLVLTWFVPWLNCITLPFSIVLIVCWRKNLGVKAVQRHFPAYLRSAKISQLRW